MRDKARKLLQPRVFLALAVVTGFFVFVGLGTGGVGNNTLIELDGNAFVNATTTGLDWSCLFGVSGVTGIPDAKCASTPTPTSSIFKTDPAAAFSNSNVDDSIGGGSADIEDINQWHGVVQSVPAKDDLEHAGWAAYQDPGNNHLITYFVADRYSNNGSAFLGEWFFKGNVSKNADGSYNGSHQDGDTLVLIDNAGNVSNAPSEVGVFQWDAGCQGKAATGHLGLPCSGDDNLATVLPIGNADCSVSGGGPVCASFNTSGGDSNPAVTVRSAWPFQASRNAAAANTYDTAQFVEGAIDLTAVLNGQDCFTSVQAETRSSNSLTAELKDTVLGRLTTCGTINIVKDAQPDAASTPFGFTATGLTPATFNLTDDGSNAGKSAPQTYLDVKPTTDGGGPYAVSEGTVSGWTLDSRSCSNGSPVTAITVARGETVTCTFVNKPTPAHLTLVKVVDNTNGGTKAVADFPLTATGPTSITGVSGTAAVTNASVTAGSYALTEQTQAGYDASTWSCTGTGTLTGSSIALAPGGNATCTITNTAQPAHLTLVKIVDNTAGGTKTVTDFPLTATGPTTPITGVSGTAAVTNVTVHAGSYALTEGTQAGYDASAWVCTGTGTQTASSIALASGQSATCTITNTARPAHLTLVKIVDNTNGGTKTVTDFPLTATGPTTPITGVSGTAAVTNVSVLPGSYALSEQTQTGYTASAWVCTGTGNQTNASIELALGQSATCTITNTAQPAHLTLVKIVNNANGGTKTLADFPLTATGPTPITGVSGTSAVSNATVNAGSYALTEQTQPGYTASAWVCTGTGTQTNANIALAPGQSATCTITNTAQPAHLTLVKVVNNANGGTKTLADFPLTATGPTPITGVSGTSAVTNATVNAGSYALTEQTQPGYTASAWLCNGGTQTGSSIALGLGQSATCTITNTAQPAHLTLVKVVNNANGGTKTIANFPLTATGPTPITGVSGTGAVTNATVNAGSYALTEQTQPGYTASAWVCNGGTQTGSSIALALGESATCTITNTSLPAHLTLVKVVNNNHGGTKTISDFPLTATGPTTITGVSATAPVTGATVKAGSYALSETQQYGYSASAWQCTGGSLSGSTLTLGNDESATCTITNSDLPGTIIVKKVSKPTNTGSFAFTTNGTGYNGFTIPGGGQNSQTVDAGHYTVTESTQLGWILTGIGGANTGPYDCVITGSGGSTGVGDLNTQTATIDIKNGDTVTCTFENSGQGTTRTQGFWATHSPLASIAWFGGSAFGHTFPGVAGNAGIGDTTLCGRPIDTLGKLMGGFWSDVSKTSTGGKRSALDQVRMQLLQQMLAAELNASAFGAVPPGGTGMFASWEAAYCGTNQNAIKTAQQQAASFNTSGDSGTFTPGTSADSKNARAIAIVTFWDLLP
jgi:hypothetical protein